MSAVIKPSTNLLETRWRLTDTNSIQVGSTPGPVETNLVTRRPATRRPRPPPDFLADNPFIGPGGGTEDNVSLSPGDVMAILNMIGGNNNNNFNNNNNNNQPLFTTCPAATLCVDRSRCGSQENVEWIQVHDIFCSGATLTV